MCVQDIEHTSQLARTRGHSFQGKVQLSHRPGSGAPTRRVHAQTHGAHSPRPSLRQAEALAASLAAFDPAPKSVSTVQTDRIVFQRGLSGSYSATMHRATRTCSVGSRECARENASSWSLAVCIYLSIIPSVTQNT